MKLGTKQKNSEILKFHKNFRHWYIVAKNWNLVHKQRLSVQEKPHYKSLNMKGVEDIPDLDSVNLDKQ